MCKCVALQVTRLTGLNCAARRDWSLQLLQACAPRLVELQMVQAHQEHLEMLRCMPALRVLTVECVGEFDPDDEDLDGMSDSERRMTLEVIFWHQFNLDNVQFTPLPRLSGGASGGLRWLRVGICCWATTKALVRAHADTQQELELCCHSHSADAYAVPFWGFKALRRLVLRRSSELSPAMELFHNVPSCASMVRSMRQNLPRWTDADGQQRPVTVLCSECDKEQVAGYSSAIGPGSF